MRAAGVSEWVFVCVACGLVSFWIEFNSWQHSRHSFVSRSRFNCPFVSCAAFWLGSQAFGTPTTMYDCWRHAFVPLYRIQYLRSVQPPMPVWSFHFAESIFVCRRSDCTFVIWHLHLRCQWWPMHHPEGVAAIDPTTKTEKPFHLLRLVENMPLWSVLRHTLPMSMLHYPLFSKYLLMLLLRLRLRQTNSRDFFFRSHRWTTIQQRMLWLDWWPMWNEAFWNLLDLKTMQ